MSEDGDGRLADRPLRRLGEQGQHGEGPIADAVFVGPASLLAGPLKNDFTLCFWNRRVR
jgi:hypothetical protein